MRFFLLLLVAALVADLNAQQVLEKIGASYKLPNGLPDGSIITFFVWHYKGPFNFATTEPEPISINFYDQPVVTSMKQFDIPAHLRMDRSWDAPLISNSYVNGKWGQEVTREQPQDVLTRAAQWWRVDVIKVDSMRLNVFCQGYWSDVRTFDKSLDNLRSVYIMSDFVYHTTAQITVKFPNSNLVPLSFDQFKDFINIERSDFEKDRKLISVPRFPVNSHISMSVVLRGSAEAKGKEPALLFTPTGKSTFFMKIVQLWRWDWFPTFPNWEHTHELFLTHKGGWGSRPEGEPCTNVNTRPNGDVVHLVLRRISRRIVRMEVLFKNVPINYATVNSAVTILTCDHEFPVELADQMDQPFDIMSHHGAFIIHIEHSIRATASP